MGPGVFQPARAGYSADYATQPGAGARGAGRFLTDPGAAVAPMGVEIGAMRLAFNAAIGPADWLMQSNCAGRPAAGRFSWLLVFVLVRRCTALYGN